jgi:protein gp37
MCTYVHIPSFFWQLMQGESMHPSNIEWTEATWNPIRGCFKVSPGCKHCYAEAFAERFLGVPGHPYEQGFDVRLVPHKLADPLRWTRPTTIFVNSMSDLFHEEVPTAYIRTNVYDRLNAQTSPPRWHYDRGGRAL